MSIPSKGIVVTLGFIITLANIDCSTADDSDRIAFDLITEQIVIKQCSHSPSNVRYCIDRNHTEPEMLTQIRNFAGARNSDDTLHAGIATKTRVGGSPLLVPIVNGIQLSEISLPWHIARFVSTTVRELTRNNGLSLATYVA